MDWADEKAREIGLDFAEPLYPGELGDADLDIIATALRAERRRALERARDIAKTEAAAAASTKAEDKAELGKDYDMNCYGAGHVDGRGDAARGIVDAIQSEIDALCKD